MKNIMLSEDVGITKLEDNYIVQSVKSSKYCLINYDAYCVLKALPQMSIKKIDEIYNLNMNFWDDLSSNGIVLISECDGKEEVI